MHVSFSTSSLASCGSCVYNVSVCVTEHKKRAQDLESDSKAHIVLKVKFTKKKKEENSVIETVLTGFV